MLAFVGNLKIMRVAKLIMFLFEPFHGILLRNCNITIKMLDIRV